MEQKKHIDALNALLKNLVLFEVPFLKKEEKKNTAKKTTIFGAMFRLDNSANITLTIIYLERNSR